MANVTDVNDFGGLCHCSHSSLQAEPQKTQPEIPVTNLKKNKSLTLPCIRIAKMQKSQTPKGTRDRNHRLNEATHNQTKPNLTQEVSEQVGLLELYLERSRGDLEST